MSNSSAFLILESAALSLAIKARAVCNSSAVGRPDMAVAEAGPEPTDFLARDAQQKHPQRLDETALREKPSLAPPLHVAEPTWVAGGYDILHVFSSSLAARAVCAPRSSRQRAILHRSLQYIWTEPTTARVQQVSRSVSRACCSKCGERATPTPRPPSTRVFPCQPLSRALDRIAPCSSIHLNRPRPAIPRSHSELCWVAPTLQQA